MEFYQEKVFIIDQLWVLLAYFWSHTILAIVLIIMQTFRVVVLFRTVVFVNLRTEQIQNKYVLVLTNTKAKQSLCLQHSFIMYSSLKQHTFPVWAHIPAFWFFALDPSSDFPVLSFHLEERRSGPAKGSVQFRIYFLKIIQCSS